MALGTLGTNANTSLKATAAWAATLSEADIAAIAATITPDSRIAAILAGFGAGASGMIGAGATHSTTSLTGVTRVSGAAIGTIQVGDIVLGTDIPPGTFVTVVAAGGATLTISQAATGTNASAALAIVRRNPPGLSRNANLVIPSRGILKVLPGDIVAIDNTGWPILVSGAAIGYSESQWNLV